MLYVFILIFEFNFKIYYIFFSNISLFFDSLKCLHVSRVDIILNSENSILIISFLSIHTNPLYVAIFISLVTITSKLVNDFHIFISFSSTEKGCILYILFFTFIFSFSLKYEISPYTSQRSLFFLVVRWFFTMRVR